MLTMVIVKESYYRTGVYRVEYVSSPEDFAKTINGDTYVVTEGGKLEIVKPNLTKGKR